MAIIKKYKSEVIDIINPVEGVYTVTFKTLGKKFKYKPGQFLHLALDEYNPSFPWPESRCFSMQSNQSDTNIKITFSIKGEYTSRMAKELKTGKVVYLKLAFGNLFSTDGNFEECVFIAGGTGVTPFLSLFTSDDFNKYISPILYFGLKNEGFDFYKEELQKASKIINSFSIKKMYENGKGMLNIKEIFNHHGVKSIYFISGPPAMINNFKEFLVKSAVAETNIITDDWK